MAYLPFGDKGSGKQMVFTACLDPFSKYLWTDLIPEGKVNPATMKASFHRLFQKGLPKFSILRVDRDPSIQKIKPMFIKKHMLLQVKSRTKTLQLPLKNDLLFLRLSVDLVIFMP